MDNSLFCSQDRRIHHCHSLRRDDRQNNAKKSRLTAQTPTQACQWFRSSGNVSLFSEWTVMSGLDGQISSRVTTRETSTMAVWGCKQMALFYGILIPEWWKAGACACLPLKPITIRKKDYCWETNAGAIYTNKLARAISSGTIGIVFWSCLFWGFYQYSLDY